jgi:inosine/xanthosine triphosphate pyrophosphatase family protein
VFIIQQGVSRGGQGYDNAFVRSCVGTLKTQMEMTENEKLIARKRELESSFSYDNPTDVQLSEAV